MGDERDSLYADATKRKKKSYHCHQGNDGRTTKFKGGTEDIKNDAFILGKKMGKISVWNQREWSLDTLERSLEHGAS